MGTLLKTATTIVLLTAASLFQVNTALAVSLSQRTMAHTQNASTVNLAGRQSTSLPAMELANYQPPEDINGPQRSQGSGTR